MSIDRIKKEKDNKFFRKGDIIVYALVAATVISLFLVVFLVLPDGKPEAIRVLSEDAAVAEYDFSGEIRLLSDRASAERTEQGWRVTVVSGGGDRNTFVVCDSERTVVMEDADCGGDCLLMKITSEKDSIVCVPNRLRIECVGAVSPPVSG